MVVERTPIADVWTWLAQIPDPEIPAISILDLGIVREVAWADDETLHVTLTPTYSACPAIAAIERDVVAALHAHGIDDVTIDIALAPAWTTDWLTASGREKLRAYGISPPRVRAVAAENTIDLDRYVDERAQCPRCASVEVVLRSRFGSTPCKSLYVCSRCLEPFDHFKSH